MLLNSVPKGSGFLMMKEMLGRPPVLSLRGRQADIDSSRSFITDAATVFDLFLLKASSSRDHVPWVRIWLLCI
jgi:hypothetical protein